MTTTTPEMSGVLESEVALDGEATASAVSWGAIVAGAFATAALSLILLSLGAGFGLSTVSPWTTSWASVKAVGVASVIWFVISQWLSAGLGGYLTGRLRIKWVGVHSDEVLFRDTAHGFVAWAVAAVVSVALLTSALTALGIGGVSLASGRPSGSDEPTGLASQTTEYYVDMLFRSSNPATEANDQAVRGPAMRILTKGLRNSDLPPGDRSYLGQLVAARTALSQADSEKRVDDVFAQANGAAKEAADTARKGAAYLAFATCLSMLVGAFVASVAAAIGGRQRDLEQGAVMER